MKPLAVDLCCGLGGWTSGLLAEGWDVIGFDIERHVYGTERYPAQLVIQDIRTLTGQQFKGHVSLIVASPPCQEYSYMAMPWRRAKQIAAEYRSGERDIAKLNELFNACVRIGREAECPCVIENVRGAQPWVGRSRWAWGSFHLWGDVPALMPMTFALGTKRPGISWSGSDDPNYKAVAFNDTRATKGIPHRPTGHWTNPAENGGIKQGGDWFNANNPSSITRITGSKSTARKAASALIAKIPEPLSRYIARVYYPR